MLSRTIRSSVHSSFAARLLSAGTVKWFDRTKGFGFITPDEAIPEGDIFVHFSSVQSSGFKYLVDGERVQFDFDRSGPKVRAVNVTDEKGEAFDPRRVPPPPRDGGARRSSSELDEFNF